MVIGGRVLAEIFCIAALLNCFVVAVIEGLSTTDHANNCTTQSSRCCKLGRKAARHNSMSPIYTCYYEALIAGLDHQSSVANRLRASKGRLRQMKNIARATSFRRRLVFCYSDKLKECFQSCCIAKRERIHKLLALKQKPTVAKPAQGPRKT